jgi:hypothetical protein
MFKRARSWLLPWNRCLCSFMLYFLNTNFNSNVLLISTSLKCFLPFRVSSENCVYIFYCNIAGFISRLYGYLWFVYPNNNNSWKIQVAKRNIQVLWDVTLWQWVFPDILKYCSAFEISEKCLTTQPNMPENFRLQQHRCENLQSRKLRRSSLCSFVFLAAPRS